MKKNSSYTTMLVYFDAEKSKNDILEAISLWKWPVAFFNYEGDITKHVKKDEQTKVSFTLEFSPKEMKKLTNYLRGLTKNWGDLELEFEFLKKEIVLNGNKNQNPSKFAANISYKIKSISKIGVFSNKKNEAGKFIFIENNSENPLKKEIRETKTSFNRCYSEHIKAYVTNHLLPSSNVISINFSAKNPLNNIIIKRCIKRINAFPILKNMFIIAKYKDDNEIIKDLKLAISSQNVCKKIESKISYHVTEFFKKLNCPWKVKFQIEKGVGSISFIDEKMQEQPDWINNGQSKSWLIVYALILLQLEKYKLPLNEQPGKFILINGLDKKFKKSELKELREMLIGLGENHYVFLATNSPYLYDTNHLQRNILVRTNEGLTEIDPIKSDHTTDEYSSERCFGKFLEIWVEGKIDKHLLAKAIKVKGIIIPYKMYVGKGYDIVQNILAGNRIRPKIIILDDDKAGKDTKEELLKKNRKDFISIFTLKELVPAIPEGGTIEDLLDPEFILEIFNSFALGKYFSEKIKCWNERTPIIQYLQYLNWKKSTKFTWSEFQKQFKSKLYDRFSKADLTKHIKLISLLESINKNIWIKGF